MRLFLHSARQQSTTPAVTWASLAVLAGLGLCFGYGRFQGFGRAHRVADGGLERLPASSGSTQPTATFSSPDWAKRPPAYPAEQGFGGLVARIGPSSFEIDRLGVQHELSKDVLRRDGSPLGRAEAAPDGGLKLTEVAADTLAAALGLRADDILRAVDGDEQFASTPERALMLYRLLYEDAATTTLSVEREGKVFLVGIRFR